MVSDQGQSPGTEPQSSLRGWELVGVVGLATAAVLAISSSAVLVRWADASPLALSLWRTAGGALILAAPAWRSGARPDRAQWRLIGVAGAALALHFAAWLASLDMTSVAASVTLVSTAPLMIAGYLFLTGHTPNRGTWAAIALALAGTMIIAGADLGGGNPTALWGDALALVGGAAVAVYLVVGQRLRAHLPTTAYASRTYGVAALILVPVVVVSGTAMTGYDTVTWVAVGAMILGPQLVGHTSLNLLLRRLGSITVSLILLAEPVGASLLAWLALGEIPPAGALLGGPLVLAALTLRVRSETPTDLPHREPQPVVPDQ